MTTDSRHGKPVAENVLDRRFDGWATNQAWVADITSILTGEGGLYWACVLDRGRRRIVGGSMSERIKASWVCDARTMAYWRRTPGAGLIMHSDRGVQYARDAQRKRIKEYRIIQSMRRKANGWDNSVMESFFKTLKVEPIHRLRYETRAQARLDWVDWMAGSYNSQRLHSSIDYPSPTEFERSTTAAKA